MAGDPIAWGLIGGLKPQLKETGETFTTAQLVSLINDKAYKPSIYAADAFGEEVIFQSSNTSLISACQISEDKILVAYSNVASSSRGECRVLTISDQDITASGAVVFDAGATNHIKVCKINTDKIAIVYFDVTPTAATVIVGTISGTTVTFGTGVAFETVTNVVGADICSIDDDKIAVAFISSVNTYAGRVIVATIAGTVPTFGTGVNFLANTLSNNASISITNVDTDKIFVACRDASPYYGKCAVATIVGTVPTFGSVVTFEVAAVLYVNAVSLHKDKACIVYSDLGNANRGTIVVATIVGTVPTIGTPVVFETGGVTYLSATALTEVSAVASYSDTNNASRGTFCVLNLQDTTPAANTPLVYNSATTQYTAIAQSNDDKVVTCYSDSTGFGTAIVLELYTEKAATGYAPTGQSPVAGINKIPYISF